MQITEKYLIIGNKNIYTRIASPVTQAPASVIVLVHGIGDHSGRYLEWFDKFEDAGVAWVTADLPGHGKSDGQQGLFNSMQAPFTIVEQLITMAEIRFPKIPIILYGHSMGGNIVANFALRRHPKLDGMILTSPWLGLVNSPPKWKIKFAEIAALFVPKMTMKTGIKREQLSCNQDALEKFEKDPLIHGKITLGTFLLMYNAMRYVNNHAEYIQVPSLLIHGTSDPITDWKATKKMALKIGRKCTFIPFEGMLHELHFDPNSDNVAKKIIEWIKSTVIHNYES
ncbi:MAG: lysophospholipase [Salinivirgaceae bacterium]|nr:lysophospholipase [Salinivirgaceae bacterium]MDD4748219.1 lysophospholipase [Salinivirgaceae bacterium]MDY0279628.1 alpha/beta hydrolase [Salinivirgaceae bacterium]